MQTNDITPMEQTPEEKRSSRKAIVLAGVAALGLAAALGTGFMLGNGGDDGARTGGVSGEQVVPTQQAQVSPTASVAAQAPQAADGTTADTSAGEIAGAPGAAAGDAVAGDPPACDAVDPGIIEPLPEAPPALPPCPACPPIGPGVIEPLPEDPPALPVLPPLTPCLACPPIDPGLIVPVPPAAPAAPLLPPPPPCLVCGPIVPGIIVHADATPPVISGVDFRPCLGRVSVSFGVNEHADLWVTYTDGGAARTTAHQSGTHGDFALTGGPLSPIRNIVLHAVDDAGNETALPLASGSTICF